MTESTPKTEYVLGFLFDDAHDKVMLIRKDHPEWQRDLFNGIGGHVNKGEDPGRAMVREAFEEAGLIYRDIWEKYHQFEGDGFIVHCYRTFNSPALGAAITMTTETLSIFWAHLLPNNTIKGLHNLVNLALANPAWEEQKGAKT